jgi:hypothetical protein
MTNKKIDEKLWTAIGVMILITLFIPYAALYWFTIFLPVEMEAIVGVGIYAILWAYFPDHHNYARFQIFTLGIIMGSAILGIFNILFGIVVVRYCMGKTKKRNVDLSALLTFFFPLYQAFLYLPHLYELGILEYIGPIPIQLIIGLIIAKRYGPREIDSPW